MNKRRDEKRKRKYKSRGKRKGMEMNLEGILRERNRQNTTEPLKEVRKNSHSKILIFLFSFSCLLQRMKRKTVISKLERYYVI